MGFDDPHKIVVVPGIGIGLSGRRDIVRVAGQGEKLLCVGADRVVLLFLNKRA